MIDRVLPPENDERVLPRHQGCIREDRDPLPQRCGECGEVYADRVAGWGVFIYASKDGGRIDLPVCDACARQWHPQLLSMIAVRKAFLDHEPRFPF